MPTLYSFGKPNIVGMASLSGVAGVNKRRSAANTPVITGKLSVRITFHLYLILNHRIIRLKIKVSKLAIIIGKA